MTAFYTDQRYDGNAVLHQQNPFARRNVTTIVLEVPSELIGKGKINAWATISLFGHAPEVQVSRWGLPLVTHLFLNDPSDEEVKEQFNASVPFEDLERFAKSIADFAEKMTTLNTFDGSAQFSKGQSDALGSRATISRAVYPCHRRPPARASAGACRSSIRSRSERRNP